MDDTKPNITEKFISSMVDRVVGEINKKLDELDVSLDYIAAALLDDSAIGIASKQAQMGRFARLPPKAVRPRRGAGIDDKE